MLFFYIFFVIEHFYDIVMLITVYVSHPRPSYFLLYEKEDENCLLNSESKKCINSRV